MKSPKDVRPLRPKPRRLTTANRTRVARMLAKGISAAAIAAHFGVPTKVIEGLATETPNRYTCSRLDEEAR